MLQARLRRAEAERVVLNALQRAQVRKQSGASARSAETVDPTVTTVRKLLPLASVAAAVRERVTTLCETFRLHLTAFCHRAGALFPGYAPPSPSEPPETRRPLVLPLLLPALLGLLPLPAFARARPRLRQ